MNHADIKCQDAYLASLFGNVQMSSLVERAYASSGDFQDRITAQARLEASRLIKIFAGQDIIFQGSETISEVSTHILALARIFDIPAILVSQKTELLSGKYDGTETWVHIHNHVSRHSSGGAFTQESGDSQDLRAPTINAASVNIEAVGDITFEAVYDQYINTFQGEKGSKKIQGHESSRKSRGGNVTSREREAQFTSHQKSLSLTALNLKGGHGTILRAPNGKVEILLGRNSFDASYSSNSDGMMWKKMVQEGESHLTFTVPSTDGPVTIYAKETLLESIQGKQLAFLDDLDVKEGSFINQVVLELHDQYSDVIEGPGMALAIIVAVVVSCCTGGAGLAGALGSALTSAGASTGLATALSIGFTAAINTGITNHIFDTIRADGNIFEATQKSFSGERLREAGISGLKAGATQYVGGKIDGLFGKDISLDFSTQFIKDLSKNAAAQTIGAGVDSVVNEADFQQAFFQGLQTAAVNTILDTARDGISNGMSYEAVMNHERDASPPLDDPSMAETTGRITAGMVRNFASHSILGESPRDALVKAIAQASAELAFLGASGAITGIMDGFGDAGIQDDYLDEEDRRYFQESMHNSAAHHDDIEDAIRAPQAASFFGAEEVPSVKLISDLDQGAQHSNSTPFAEPEIHDTPWVNVDEMFRTSDMGLAYHAQYPVDPLQEFYHPDGLGRDAFNLLSDGNVGLSRFAAETPFTSACVSRTIDLIGEGLHWGTQMGVSFIAGDIGLLALDGFEQKMGEIFLSGAKDFESYGQSLARNPIESLQYNNGSNFALESLASGMVLMNVRGLKKGLLVKAITTKPRQAMVSLGEGYHLRMVKDKPHIIRNPGRAADLPQLRLDGNQVVNLFDVNRNTSQIVNALSTRNSAVPSQLPFDKYLARSYIREMEQVTGRTIKTHQRLLLKEDLKAKNFVALLPAEKTRHRNQFDSKRNKLIAEWERHTEQTWPRYTALDIKNRGLPLKKLDKPYDAHEMIPNAQGGPLKWHNLHPARAPDQHQKLIHGKDAVLTEILKQTKKN